jgi:hypothetical protein
VGGRAEIFELLVVEDINGDQVDLCVTVLAGLGGAHFDDLARAVLDDDETVLAQSRALHGIGGGRAGIGGLEGVLMLWRLMSVKLFDGAYSPFAIFRRSGTAQKWRAQVPRLF